MITPPSITVRHQGIFTCNIQLLSFNKVGGFSFISIFSKKQPHVVGLFQRRSPKWISRFFPNCANEPQCPRIGDLPHDIWPCLHRFSQFSTIHRTLWIPRDRIHGSTFYQRYVALLFVSNRPVCFSEFELYRILVPLSRVRTSSWAIALQL
mgnify:CR=1 FL=1